MVRLLVDIAITTRARSIAQVLEYRPIQKKPPDLPPPPSQLASPARTEEPPGVNDERWIDSTRADSTPNGAVPFNCGSAPEEPALFNFRADRRPRAGHGFL